MNKLAIISGATGQDGSYLSENLLDNNYTVIGLYRRLSTNNFSRLKSVVNNKNFILVEFDITDPGDCYSVISTYKPNEFYNLAAQSHVGTSFSQPTTTFEIGTIGVINILEAIRKFSPSTKMYQASTSEMFGENFTEKTGNKFQNEQTAFLPQSPYGIAKMASHRLIQIYRSSYNLFACSGILFNHESPRRGENFVTRKITKYIAKLVNKTIDPQTKLGLGNLDAYRDWGHAKDYVEAMKLMLQNSKANDYVISTGITHSVREFCEKAFDIVGLNYKDHIYIDTKFYRPSEVEYLKGNSDLAKKELGWAPSISFDDLIVDMVHSDIEREKNA
jgi:GDPmannose 4,6-dehydratase